MQFERKIWAAFLLLSVAWGTSFMFIKIAVQTVQPLTLVALRLFVGWTSLIILLRWRDLSLPRSGRVWAHIAVVALVNVAVPFALIAWAESGVNGLPSGVASVINSTVPLFSVIIAGFALRMERVTIGVIAGLIAGFAGVVVLFGGDIGDDLGNILPYLAVLGATLFYAIAAIYVRRYLQGTQPIALAAGQLLVADIIVTAGALLFEEWGQQEFLPLTVVSIVWLGLVGSCLAYVLYFYVLQAWGATRATTVTYLIPVVGVTVGVVFLGEDLTWRLFVGGLLIIVGVATVNLRPWHRLQLQARRGATD